VPLPEDPELLPGRLAGWLLPPEVCMLELLQAATRAMASSRLSDFRRSADIRGPLLGMQGLYIPSEVYFGGAAPADVALYCATF